jgi:hypothetical protein
MTWILIICTNGWLICGSIDRFEYQDKESCYEALEQVYKQKNMDGIKYVVCQPKIIEKKG